MEELKVSMKTGVQHVAIDVDDIQVSADRLESFFLQSPLVTSAH